MIEWYMVGVNDARVVWASVEDETRDCLAKGVNNPANSIDIVRDQVLSGQLLLALAREGVKRQGSSVIKLAGQTAQAITVAGEGLANKQSAEQYFKMLREKGATRVQALCQPAEARLWGRVGFKPTHQIMEANIWVDS